MKGFVIAGERSGVGKTTLTMALAEAFIRRGEKVQCFKVGPDFIDSSYHAVITGRKAQNLDGWMMGKDYSVYRFEESARDADMVIVEGVMGLFDGYDPKSDDGSTAQIAKWLNLPVILIVDAGSFARTAGALVLGFEQFDPDIEIAGVIFNKVASATHFEALKEGVAARCRAAVLGYVPRGSEWAIPERHLGLVMAEEHDNLKEIIQSISQHIEKTIDIDSIAKCSNKANLPDTGKKFSLKKSSYKKAATIGVARDEAFCFYYQDNLDYLEHFGAEINYFSPIHDKKLPDNMQGLYLGGGYPELYASALNNNNNMLEQVRAFCRSGKPVYAECGGFLYLLESITDQDDGSYTMVGLFPAASRMMPRLQRLGYVEVEAQNGCPFLVDGEKIRGHEFHYSEISEMTPEINRCYKVYRKRSREILFEGYRTQNVLAGYMHLHFGSNPLFAEGFVNRCIA